MNKKLILLLIIVGIFLSLNSFGVHAQDGNCTNYANYSSGTGNKSWIITNTTLCQTMNITDIMSITIRNGGSLYLQGINLSFSGNSTNSLGILVESGGVL